MEISSGIELTTTAVSNSTDECAAEVSIAAYSTFYLIAIGVLVICNTFLLIATASDWRVLRQNIVYRYLVSCLLSSIAFCLLGAYEIYHTLAHVDDNIVEGGILQRYNSHDTTHQHVMTSWAFRRTLLPCLLIVMEFNVAVLIYAVEDNTPYVGRYSEPGHTSRPSPPNEQTTSVEQLCIVRLGGKTFKASCQIFVAWMIPLILSIPAGLRWNCLQNCKCLPAIRSTVTCHTPESGDVCSRAWHPTTRSFVIVITIMYFGAIAYMFTVLGLTIRKFYKTHAPRKSRTGHVAPKSETNSKDGVNQEESSHSDGGDSLRPQSQRLAQDPSTMELGKGMSKSSLTDAPISTVEFVDEGNKNRHSATSFKFTRHRRPPLHSTIKLLIALTVSIFISVTPMIFICFYDVIIYPAPIEPETGMNISIAITYLHSASLPFILLGCMSGLRKACVDILIKCPCLRTTVVIKKRPNRSTEKKIRTLREKRTVSKSKNSVNKARVSEYSTISIRETVSADKREGFTDEKKEVEKHEAEDRHGETTR